MIFNQTQLKLMHDVITQLILQYKSITVADCIIIHDNEDFEVDYSTMLSYFNQLTLRKWKNNKQSREIDDEILYCLYHKKEDIISLARRYGCSSYRITKIFLERLHSIYKIHHCDIYNVSVFIDNPHIILDNTLRHELLSGITNDLLCSPLHDQLKECVGKEYESYLIDKLKAKNMVFETENDLRNKGKSKTPDILFLIPMMTRFTLKDYFGIVIKEMSIPSINWIDSKG